VIIPVLNRRSTICDAIQSALTQTCDFAFNVIVVDNHSTDGTSELLSDLARKDSRLVHLVPERKDLGIGGCWDTGIRHFACGRWSAQLDSDDVYTDKNVLQRIVDTLEDGPWAMLVGSYHMTDFEFNEIPPGLIDHREWTDTNGHNNLLRVNGIGAPRAFSTTLLRQLGYPNQTYGEDYTLALRISREFHIERIWEPLYLCRRWHDNSDADLPVETENRYDTYRDRMRSLELTARTRLASGESGIGG
jgi:glycosyltransferase involved in cell wall biosynthesis